ncbi:hypothetical protein OZX62_03490 [Bifidobacterium sp. ESL0690]|uniref:hypothetical protein n=1 Tax=Bifidobacterium sp. ESL0690 TaxID=2983214 RepID=UPI0023F90950|nr:hypothetical protein [Bifidobacterium sp. ESL0690]WEV47348.1 hypothetical protein OZX62_03490 [Bifidobacterium sp. ESL0690]
MTGAFTEMRKEWTPESVSGVGFTSEHLATLIGGADYARCAVPVDQVPLGYVGEQDTLDEMREDLVASYEGLGLVDRDGNPCPALAHVLDPIRDCRFDVADGFIPDVAPMIEKGLALHNNESLILDDVDDDDSDDSQPDERTFCVCFGRRSATMICRTFSADRPGYALLDLGGPENWEESFMKATHLARLWRYSKKPNGFSVDASAQEDELVSHMLDGDIHAAKSCEAVHPEFRGRLSELADGLMNPDRFGYKYGIKKIRYESGTMVSHDYRRTWLGGDSQERDRRFGPEPYTASIIVPKLGVVYSSTFMPPDDAHSVWLRNGCCISSRFEFVGSGSVLERLTGIPQSQWLEDVESTKTIGKNQDRPSS